VLIRFPELFARPLPFAAIGTKHCDVYADQGRCAERLGVEHAEAAGDVDRLQEKHVCSLSVLKIKKKRLGVPLWPFPFEHQSRLEPVPVRSIGSSLLRLMHVLVWKITWNYG